jgi:hypothetical protein
MKTIKNIGQLENEIGLLEQSIELREIEMKQKLVQVKNSLNPRNAMNNIFAAVADTPEVKKALIHSIVGIAMAFAYKKSKELLSEESLTHLLSSLLNYGLEKLEHDNPDSIVSKGIHILRRVTPPDSPYAPFVHRYYYDQQQ